MPTAKPQVAWTTKRRTSTFRPPKNAYRAVAELRERLQVRAREWGVLKMVRFRDLGGESFLVDVPMDGPNRETSSIRAVNAHKVRFNCAGATIEVGVNDTETIIDAMDAQFETLTLAMEKIERGWTKIEA